MPAYSFRQTAGANFHALRLSLRLSLRHGLRPGQKSKFYYLYSHGEEALLIEI